MGNKIKSFLGKLGFAAGKGNKTDVICRIRASSVSAKYASEYAGKVYYFCSEHCKTNFNGNPGKYAGITNA